MISDERLDELERLANNATPGPWGIEVADHDCMRIGVVTTENDYNCGNLVAELVVEIKHRSPDNLSNARLCAVSRTAVPELVDEVRRLRSVVHDYEISEYVVTISYYIQENDRLQEALRKIDQWAKAYPVDIFPEPDFKKAHEILTANGMTLDAISASIMRHVISGVRKIAESALEVTKC